MGCRQENSDISGQSTLVNAPVKARLKWFNAPKGFGFVNPEDKEDVDAFLHITTLQNIGIQTIGEDACLLCEIEYGDKGAHVKQILEVIDTGETSCGCFKNSDSTDQFYEMSGVVKWYKPDEGFGFITPADGLKDIFIHKTCLERHNIESLQSGQKLLITFRNVPKGREVVSFKVIDDKI